MLNLSEEDLAMLHCAPRQESRYCRKAFAITLKVKFFLELPLIFINFEKLKKKCLIEGKAIKVYLISNHTRLTFNLFF